MKPRFKSYLKHTSSRLVNLNHIGSRLVNLNHMGSRLVNLNHIGGRLVNLNHMGSRLAVAILAAIGTLPMAARTQTDSVTVSFRQSHTELDPEFNRNGERLDSVAEVWTQENVVHPLRRLVDIRVFGAASPEGSVKFNDYLSRERARSIYLALKERGMIPDSVKELATLTGRDWKGLQACVATDMNVPYRADVLTLLQRINSPESPLSHPLSALKGLRGGRPYLYMYNNIFPGLRRSQLILEYEILPASFNAPSLPPITEDTLAILPPGNVDLPLIALGDSKQCKPFYMDLRTNMLLDALALPNIGADFYIGKGWSLNIDWLYGWWDNDARHRYWRAYGGWIGARRWFGRQAQEKPLTGHHLGVYAGVVTYDFEFGGEGIMGGLPHRTLWDRCNYLASVEYGYSLPVSRRLNIDFSIAFGYIGGKYLKYKPQDSFYIWESTHKLHWVGPTNIGVSLVWLIGCDNYNKKGGAR